MFFSNSRLSPFLISHLCFATVERVFYIGWCDGATLTPQECHRTHPPVEPACFLRPQQTMQPDRSAGTGPVGLHRWLSAPGKRFCGRQSALCASEPDPSGSERGLDLGSAGSLGTQAAQPALGATLLGGDSKVGVGVI